MSVDWLLRARERIRRGTPPGPPATSTPWTPGNSGTPRGESGPSPPPGAPGPLGLLEELLREPGATDVLVNGPDEVWVDGSAGLIRSALRFADADAVRALAECLVARTGRRLDDAHPWVDARLPDGLRLHVVLPPLAPDGPCLCLRVAARRVFDLDALIAAGTLTPRLAAVCAALVRCRVPFVVTGGTATGKTTLLASLLSLVPEAERVVLVEDLGELRPQHPHVVRLEARPANVEGAGGVGLGDLVRQALRMRPDRLVVGEVRGAEVVDLLAALNTGHAGGCSTVHANRAADVPARFEALGTAAGLSREAVHSQLVAGLRVVVHLERVRSRRWVSEVGVLRRSGDGVVTVPALQADLAGEHRGGGYAELAALLDGTLPP